MRHASGSFLWLAGLVAAALCSAAPLGAQNCANTSVGFTPLDDLGPGLYQGFPGGLYPGGTKARPADVWIKGDAESLALALRNPIDNALKYSPAGEQVEVRWTASDGRLSISVTDRGPGIPREEQEVIFRKFVRGTTAIEASVKGTGVGLAMVRHIVTAHDAEIRLESQLGQGSTFTIVLPVWEGGS